MDIIKKYEGFRNKAYKDVGGVWTIGYGTTFLTKFDRAVESDDIITKEDAEYELSNHIKKKVSPAIDKLSSYGYDLPDILKKSLTSIAYNAGTACLKSNRLTAALKNKDQEELKKWFMSYIHVSGNVVQGLVNRRQEEVSNWYGKIWV